MPRVLNMCEMFSTRSRRYEIYENDFVSVVGYRASQIRSNAAGALRVTQFLSRTDLVYKPQTSRIGHSQNSDNSMDGG